MKFPYAIRLISGLSWAFIGQASANVFDTYGQGASSVAIGNATTAGGPSAYAAFSNPALLTRYTGVELSSSLLYTSFNLRDLPEAPGAQLPPDTFKPSRAPSISGASLGINLKLTERLHGGLAAYMPQGNFGRIRGLSAYQTSYLRFSEQQQKPAVYTAMAYKFSDALSIGFGAYYSLRAKGFLQISLSDRESEGRFDFIMEPIVVPYAGILWQQAEWSFGGFYRRSQETQSRIASSFTFNNSALTLPFDATTSLVPFYDPELMRLGASYQSTRHALYFSLERASWSAFRAPLVTISGNDVASLSAEGLAQASGLTDTWALRGGAAWTLPEVPLDGSVDMKAGIELHSSANQRGKPSSVADPSRSVLAFGAAWNLLPDAEQRRLTLEAAWQIHRLNTLNTQSVKGSSLAIQGGSTIQSLVTGLSYAL